MYVLNVSENRNRYWQWYVPVFGIGSQGSHVRDIVQGEIGYSVNQDPRSYRWYSYNFFQSLRVSLLFKLYPWKPRSFTRNLINTNSHYSVHFSITIFYLHHLLFFWNIILLRDHSPEIWSIRILTIPCIFLLLFFIYIISCFFEILFYYAYYLFTNRFNLKSIFKYSNVRNPFSDFLFTKPYVFALYLWSLSNISPTRYFYPTSVTPCHRILYF